MLQATGEEQPHQHLYPSKCAYSSGQGQHLTQLGTERNLVTLESSECYHFFSSPTAVSATQVQILKLYQETSLLLDEEDVPHHW